MRTPTAPQPVPTQRADTTKEDAPTSRRDVLNTRCTARHTYRVTDPQPEPSASTPRRPWQRLREWMTLPIVSMVIFGLNGTAQTMQLDRDSSGPRLAVVVACAVMFIVCATQLPAVKARFKRQT